MKIKRIVILTSGGDCGGLNAVVRAVTYRAIEKYGWEVFGIRDGTTGLMQRPLQYEKLTLKRFTGNLIRQGGTFLGTTSSGNPFRFKMENGKYEDKSQDIINGYKKLRLDAFIGIGGDNCYRPNTITYVFDEIVPHEIIIAPHTTYFAEKDLRDAIAQPITDREILSLWEEDCDVLFVRPFVTLKEHRDDMNDVCNFAAQMSTMCEFVSERQAKHLKKVLNSYIRDGRQVDEEEISLQHDVDINLIRLWKLVESIKMDMFCYIETDDSMKCIIEGHEVDHEGYVMENGFGTFKLVDRETFSYHNFNLAKSWN